MTYKYWELEIDGPDKTGKDLLCRYLCELSDWRFSINVRGIMSQIVYAKKFDRDFEFDTSNFSKNKILILLEADPKDLAVRCKMTNEKEYDFENDAKLFCDTAFELSRDHVVLMYNTSHFTPYEIAKAIIEKINWLEEKHNGKVL